ncbi:hypothetical protein CLOM621_08169 [Clostridium sp. M62/1]|nr:hypothetical protein CLOM621_08169 [Clostridium sp. M62/1]
MSSSVYFIFPGFFIPHTSQAAFSGLILPVLFRLLSFPAFFLLLPSAASLLTGPPS